MAGAIATLLTVSKVVPRTRVGLRAQDRQAFDELEDLQAAGDPELAYPYLQTSGQSTIAANGGTTGNFTITVNFPKQGVEVTTGNIAFDDGSIAIQSAIDLAMAGESVLTTYVAGDVDAGLCVNMAVNSCAITANGTTVNGAYMVLTTANVDLDVASPAVTEDAVGTQNRPSEAVLDAYSVISAVSTAAPQDGSTPAEDDYANGSNPLSLSPGLIDLLIGEVQASDDNALGIYLRHRHGCV